MEFKIQQKEHPNKLKYPTDEYTLAKKFAENIEKELGSFVKCAVLFGSAARAKELHVHDIDIMLILDDLTKIMSPEVIEAYRIITENTARKISARLHISSMKLTTFWEYLRNGDPIAINMLRDGMPLYDVGIFEPAQQLLFQGRIRPTRESIWTYYARAPLSIKNAEWHVLQATLDLYWAVIDSAHAALMKLGEIPTSPAHVSELMTQKLVKTGMIPAKYSRMMDFFYTLSKKIIHRDVQEITGKEYETYKKMALDFVSTMKKVVEAKI